MAANEVIRRGRIEVRVQRVADSAIISLLNHTVLGTPGGLRYQLTGIQDRVRKYAEILFVCLYRSDTLLGSLALCRRKASLSGETNDLWYVRYFAFNEAFQAAGKRRNRQRRKKISPGSLQNNLREEIVNLFRNPDLLKIPGLSGDSLIYAFLEFKNYRSVNLVHEAGFSPVRYFSTILFSRFNPRFNNAVSLATIEDRRELELHWKKEALETNAWFDDFLFPGESYYVFREGNKIIAGVQAHPAEYAMKEMPGVKGWLFLNVLIHLPGFRKIFQQKKFRFLAFEGLFCRSGREDVLTLLFESVCAQLGHHAGMIGLDTNSPYSRYLRSSKKMGWLGKIAGQEPLGFFVQKEVAGEARIKSLEEKPVYISGFDFI